MNSFLSCLFSLLIHPYFVAFTTINYDAQEREIQIVSQFFLDDFEGALKDYYKQPSLLVSKQNDSILHKHIKQYMLQNIAIKTDDTTRNIEFLGYEIEGENMLCYTYIKNVSLPQRSVWISNRLLYNYKFQQTHLFHLKIHSKEKTARITNPNASHLFEW